MKKSKQWFFAFTVALLAVAALWGVMLTGTALAQSTQTEPPAPSWHYDMMANYLGQGIMNYGMQASGLVTGTAIYGGRGMMRSRMGAGMMGSRMGAGMMGAGMMGAGMMGAGMMDQGTMAEYMGSGAMGSMPITGTMPYACPYPN